MAATAGSSRKKDPVKRDSESVMRIGALRGAAKPAREDGAAEQKQAKPPGKKEKIAVPMTFYWLEEELREFTSNKYFPDSALSVFAFISVAIAFPFWPIEFLAVFAVVIFFLARLHPLAGLMALLFITLPVFIYQVPLLALFYCLVLAASLTLGFKHYRTITLAYTLIALPFSFLGYFLEIPAFVVGLLYIGMKRGAIAAGIAVAALPAIATLMGVGLSAPILYSSSGFSSAAGPGYQAMYTYLVGGKPAPTLFGFPGAFAGMFGTFLSAVKYFPQSFYIVALAVAYGAAIIAIQLVLWLITAFAIVNHVVKSRSPFKGSESSMFISAILAGYIALTMATHGTFDIYVLIGFALAPLLLVFMELNNIDVVRALEVMKKDFLGTFGDGFEDLTTGARETLNDIGNYDKTKDELREAILQPIEHKEIEGAYKIKPAKGILLFGPPGTGKTMLMRALANEVRARFFYVKSTSILSPNMGESSIALSRIFDRVRAHTPAILFFDEIDGIARSRDAGGYTDPELLTTLLSEMDGFQKLEGVVIVGATNVPNLIDKSLMRPGRFDRLIYMPLPDKEGRKAIFRHYSALYPMSSDVDIERLAEGTARFSGADIANVCRETATHVGNEALKESKALRITTDDLLGTVNVTKPSTAFAQLEQYGEFRTDYERRTEQESREKIEKLSVDDVVGMREAKKALREALEIPMEHPELMKEYDIKPVSGILMYGPPGTGKTMLMQAIANSMENVTLISVSGADLGKAGYDEAVNKMKEYFFRAKENSPAVLFIDEIDSLVPNRDEASEIGVRLTAEFLREFDDTKKGGNIVIVGATNRPEFIDSALIRPGRLDKLIYASPPEAEERATLFRNSLKKSPVEDNIDYDRLAAASKGFTGADIVNVCREAKMQSLEETVEGAQGGSTTAGVEKKIGTDIILRIIKGTTPSAPASVIGRYTAFEASHGRQ